MQIPGADGDFTAMADHAPTIATIRPGIVTVQAATGEEKYVVTGGFAEISPDGTSVLAERAMPVGEVTQDGDRRVRRHRRRRARQCGAGTARPACQAGRRHRAGGSGAGPAGQRRLTDRREFGDSPAAPRRKVRGFFVARGVDAWSRPRPCPRPSYGEGRQARNWAPSPGGSLVRWGRPVMRCLSGSEATEPAGSGTGRAVTASRANGLRPSLARPLTRCRLAGGGASAAPTPHGARSAQSSRSASSSLRASW